jgi:YD repeat-containing protein
VRNGTYAYDAEGRVLRSELAGGAARLDFAYGTDAGGNPTTTVTDYSGPGGSATSRTYTFADIGGVRHPSGVTAPCSLCGNTQQQSSYNAQGDPTKAIAHDGTVTFYAYNAKGQETERATFPASFNTATTRPALANATKVVSTKWHGTFNLPTQVAEPGKFTANTYNAKGMLTGQSWTATTDATGAAKFNAVNTGSTYATGWGYNANSLNTSIVTRETAQGSTTAVETARWTLAYEANGDTRRVTAVVAGATAVATLTSSATHGQLTTLSVDNGALAQFGYDARNRLVTAQLPDYGATLTHDARSLLTEVRFGPSNWLRIVYDAAGQPLRVEDSSGASQTIAEMSGWPDAEPALLQLRNWLAGLRALPPTAWLPMASARAQVPPPPPIPASVLQGMSLAQSQQSALAADALGQAMQGRCCGSAQPSLAGVQSQLQRVTLPIQLMSLAFTQAAEVMRDEFLTLKSAYKLRKNLCAAGVTELAGCHHAHHIVAVAHPRAQTSRDILASASVGIDVNDAVNGMFVPCDRHGRLHTYAYYDKVRDRLLAVNPRNRATISAALTQIRLEIASGTF